MTKHVLKLLMPLALVTDCRFGVISKIAKTVRKWGKLKASLLLVELLVVIAMTTILATILFPVFSHARKKARQTNCLSNQKQIGLGFQQCIQDYDEVFPASRP